MMTLKYLNPSLSKYIWFEEYPANPPSYTLNGYMFALIGLYDWWKVTDNEKAEELFKKGLLSLVKILPYYDFGVQSSYNLIYVTLRSGEREFEQPFIEAYHAVHIELLWALYSVTGLENLKKTADRWLTYTTDQAALETTPGPPSP